MLLARDIGDGKTENGNFLAYGSGNQPYTDIEELEKTLQAMVLGVGEDGCGIEDQLESVYQFLAAPDPWADIVVGSGDDLNGVASYSGYNESVLLQRHDFLRPDSLVSVVLVTDEDDASIDPLSVAGTGHFYKSYDFPNGNERADATRTAARGTSVCDTDPTSADWIAMRRSNSSRATCGAPAASSIACSVTIGISKIWCKTRSSRRSASCTL
jgi:hypothetical protein